MKRIAVFLLFFCILLPFSQAVAQDEPVQGFQRSTDLPLPRFVSLKADKVYVRTGPALRYPIKWIYKRENMPVEIIQEFDTWRKIRDFEGEESWIHQAMLSGERTVMVMTDDLVPMRESDGGQGRMIARLEPRVIASLERCGRNWCRIDTGGYKGWVERKSLWGIYEGEDLH